MSENRKRGGQNGNHNALKHGRYIAKENFPVVHATTQDQITVVDHLIHAIKRQMRRAYEEGQKAQTLPEVLKTMNSLSMAAIGLCRLLHMYDRLTHAPFSSIYAHEEMDHDQLIDHLLATFGVGDSGSRLG